MDTAKDRAKIGAGSAAGIKDDDFGVCETIGNAEFGQRTESTRSTW